MYIYTACQGSLGKFYVHIYTLATSFGVCNRERVALRDRAYIIRVYYCIISSGSWEGYIGARCTRANSIRILVRARYTTHHLPTGYVIILLLLEYTRTRAAEAFKQIDGVLISRGRPNIEIVALIFYVL